MHHIAKIYVFVFLFLFSSFCFKHTYLLVKGCGVIHPSSVCVTGIIMAMKTIILLV